jgi:hypothetical protein
MASEALHELESFVQFAFGSVLTQPNAVVNFVFFLASDFMIFVHHLLVLTFLVRHY